jgi:hypothetical protein
MNARASIPKASAIPPLLAAGAPDKPAPSASAAPPWLEYVRL